MTGFDNASDGSRSNWTYGKFETEQERLQTLAQVGQKRERERLTTYSMTAKGSNYV